MKLDIKDHVTQTIIAQIEAGTPPWRKPWTGDAGTVAFPLRHNGEQYRGINEPTGDIYALGGLLY